MSLLIIFYKVWHIVPSVYSDVRFLHAFSRFIEDEFLQEAYLVCKVNTFFRNIQA